MSPNWGPKTVPRVWTSDDEDDQAQRYQTVAACSVLKRFAATPQQAREVLDMLGLRTSVGSARVALIDEPDFPAYARPSSVQPPKTRPCAVPLLPDGWDPQAKHWYLMMCDIIGRDGIFPIAWRAATMDWARESFGEWIKRELVTMDRSFIWEPGPFTFRPAAITGFTPVMITDEKLLAALSRPV